MNAPQKIASLKLNNTALFRQQCYINGEWVNADTKAAFTVANPADGSQLGTVPNMGAAETRRAIKAAHAAWPAWRAKTAKERIDLPITLTISERTFHVHLFAYPQYALDHERDVT